MSIDKEVQHLYESNPGQGLYVEYKYLKDLIVSLRTCNLLIFGVGKDSKFWLKTNENGKTVFIEHEPEWIKKTQEVSPEATIYKVSYETKLPQWKELLNKKEKLNMHLPEHIVSENWDIIFVDSPQGGANFRPGRMKSIYTASTLNYSHVLVHDFHREVEREYSKKYLPNHVKTVHHLYHHKAQDEK